MTNYGDIFNDIGIGMGFEENKEKLLYCLNSKIYKDQNGGHIQNNNEYKLKDDEYIIKQYTTYCGQCRTTSMIIFRSLYISNYGNVYSIPTDSNIIYFYIINKLYVSDRILSNKSIDKIKNINIQPDGNSSLLVDNLFLNIRMIFLEQQIEEDKEKYKIEKNEIIQIINNEINKYKLENDDFKKIIKEQQETIQKLGKSSWLKKFI